jgi:hypothetical protein
VFLRNLTQGVTDYRAAFAVAVLTAINASAPGASCPLPMHLRHSPGGGSENLRTVHLVIISSYELLPDCSLENDNRVERQILVAPGPFAKGLRQRDFTHCASEFRSFGPETNMSRVEAKRETLHILSDRGPATCTSIS